MIKKRLLPPLLGLIFTLTVAYLMLPVFDPNINSTIESDPFWVTELNEEGELTVFGLTLNHSTLEEATAVFGNRLSLSLFQQDDSMQLEGYFRETSVGSAQGLAFTGRVALSLTLPEPITEEMLTQFERDKKSTSKRVIYNIPPHQHAHFFNHKIATLSFIPIAITLSEEDIIQRFGYPEKKMTEKGRDPVIHYLYPSKGVDVALDAKGKFKTVIQYIEPKDFYQAIIEPIL